MRSIRFMIAAACAAVLSCASIPAFNEAPVYSSYIESRKDGAGGKGVEVFVLYRTRGFASDDLHELFIERWIDASGDIAYALVLRYRGFTAENISRISLEVGGGEIELGGCSIDMGYSGRYIVERVSAALTERAVSALKGKPTAVSIRYYCDYRASPIEVPGPGLEALTSFFNSPIHAFDQ